MYERAFGTDWERIDDREEVVRRAFALGVAARLGETHPGELERLESQTETSYAQSFVDLAYQKGRNEAREVHESADDDEVWEMLVEKKTVVEAPDRGEDDEFDDIDPDADIFEETTVPAALRRMAVDSRPDDSTDRVGQPSFLERGGGARPQSGSDEDQSVFGRSLGDSHQRTDREESTDEPENEAEGGDRTANERDTTGASGDEGDGTTPRKEPTDDSDGTDSSNRGSDENRTDDR
ncbi:hypothetical protein [Natrialba swarupiae]|uniref:Uncharacterized protein n=1 Tax=Natrialba swarupiae TaxID=2448032 RepID=A0A5D5AKY1_9EURY|nr:hypothetical protein [Natrialba swarupiae]TYT61633.1 hypothetical protein FYC77_12240 [Natrialba swarupiae]